MTESKQQLEAVQRKRPNILRTLPSIRVCKYKIVLEVKKNNTCHYKCSDLLDEKSYYLSTICYAQLTQLSIFTPYSLSFGSL